MFLCLDLGVRGLQASLQVGCITCCLATISHRWLKFVTYAHWWVRQAIGRAIIDQRRTVRLPVHVVERKNKLRVAKTKLLADCLSGLPEREAHILRLRFGLDTDCPQTLREIGDLYGLSRERIRQLESLALKKLRSFKHSDLLADFVDVV